MVYDTGESVPEKSVMVRENGVLVAVTDLQSGTWQIARDMFEVLQKELGDKKRAYPGTKYLLPLCSCILVKLNAFALLILQPIHNLQGITYRMD